MVTVFQREINDSYLVISRLNNIFPISSRRSAPRQDMNSSLSYVCKWLVSNVSNKVLTKQSVANNISVLMQSSLFLFPSFCICSVIFLDTLWFIYIQEWSSPLISLLFLQLWVYKSVRFGVRSNIKLYKSDGFIRVLPAASTLGPQ